MARKAHGTQQTGTKHGTQIEYDPRFIIHTPQGHNRVYAEPFTDHSRTGGKTPARHGLGWEDPNWR